MTEGFLMTEEEGERGRKAGVRKSGLVWREGKEESSVKRGREEVPYVFTVPGREEAKRERGGGYVWG